MNNNDLEFYIPHNINIRDLLKKEGKGLRYIDCQIDKYHWFLDALYKRSIVNKRYSTGDFIPINHKKLGELLGSRYIVHIKKFFLSQGIIESDGDYEIDNKCLGFRLTPEYQVRHIKLLQDDDSTFIKNLKTFHQKQITKMDEITRYTYDQLNNIGIYREEAEKYVEDWYHQNYLVENPKLVMKLAKLNKKRRKRENKAKVNNQAIKHLVLTYYQLLEIMRDSYLFQIKAIDEKTWLPKRDDKGLRIHTYLSNAWKELRQFLYVKSNPAIQLVSLDCSNSQPYTLVKILLEYFNGLDLYSGEYEDTLLYIELVTTGKLYSFMCQKLSITDPEEITEFKVQMFEKIFYCANEEGYDTKAAETFRNFFPTVYQIIMHEKMFDYNKWVNQMQMVDSSTTSNEALFEHKLKLAKKNAYKQLSIQMQRVESKAILDTSVSLLKDKYGTTVWFGSIHDAILCPMELADEVRQLMLESFTSVVGIPPHIKSPEKVNVLKVRKEVDTYSELPDTTPLAELQQRFETLFASTAYNKNIERRVPETDFYVKKRKAYIEYGIEW
ncbi:hypothetical protein [Adhaeribacter aquaticus]|uniref:hypothetical protein n=1 Tax=Adhaeribacter aquaticus TaxID=299567 RepID=UPI000421F5D7|nr:hypothetical protein [Adhaeribacter aquaticus]